LDIEKKLEEIIPERMLKRGQTTLEALLSPLRAVLHQQRFPNKSLSDLQIDLLLKLLSSLDTDKDPDAARVGEREARIASPLVGELAAGFNHGVGRSGHLSAPQPKAPGASIMQEIANQVSLDAMRRLGLSNTHSAIVLPLSTGMSLGLTLAAFRKKYGVKEVLYPRIDHLSPQRGIDLSGLSLITSPTLLSGDKVECDLGELEKLIVSHGDAVVLGTTTFFPPRSPDPVKEIAKLCEEHGLPFIINNAYGVQSREVMNLIRAAIDAGRVDVVIQSGDKNFLTPVGSSIAVSPEEASIDNIAETYAGRATAAPIVQTLAALLALGLEKYESLRDQQVECREYLETRLLEIASEVGQRVLDIHNPVAAAMTLDGLDVGSLGGRLYNRRVTGPRAVAAGDFGSCIDEYPSSYLVFNAAIGATKNDILEATTKLYKELSDST
jgi:O-phospho-L-seryl-tRNASec:L-selenocysteinyl-tRNA synthase